MRQIVSLFFFAFTQAFAADVSFTAQPSVVQGGARAALTWSVSDPTSVTSVYLLGWGEVPLTGSVSLAPERTGDYLLVVERSGGTTVRRVQVVVQGSKGDEQDLETDQRLFRYPYEITYDHQSFGAFLDRVQTRLRQDLGFSPKVLEASDTHVKIQTNRWSTPGLNRNLGSQYSGRRISFLIDITTPPGKRTSVNLQVRSFIEKNRVLEDGYFPEADVQLYRQQTSNFVNLLTQ